MINGHEIGLSGLILNRKIDLYIVKIDVQLVMIGLGTIGLIVLRYVFDQNKIP